MIYLAQFTRTANKHTVIFFDEDGVSELGRAVVGHGEAAAYPNALPTKAATAKLTYTFEKWVTAKNGSEEASFENITDDISVYAKYSETARTYTVTFCDWNGTVLASSAVAYGGSATPPEQPQREEYRFIEWSGSYDRITEDCILTAKYQAEVTIRFLDYDESVLYEETVDRGGDPTALPTDPVRENYLFLGWSVTEFTDLQEDLVVYAQYVRLWRVTFLDHDGSLLQKQNVQNGMAAIAPSDPTREGYRFLGWDASYDCITSDLKVTARYEILRYTVTFIGPDEKTISTVQNVRHGFSVTAPTVDELYFDWNAKKGYRFTGWSAPYNSISADLTIRALYEEEITEPILVVRSTEVPIGTTEVQVAVYVCMQERLYGISMDVTADPAFLLGGKPNVEAGNAFTLQDGEVASITGMKNELKCEFRWTDTNKEGNGVDPSAYGGPIPVLTLKLHFYEFQATGRYEIHISEDTYLINENLEKVKPIIISGTVTLGN